MAGNLSRRSFAAGATALAGGTLLSPRHARAQTPIPTESLWYFTGEYLPRYLELQRKAASAPHDQGLAQDLRQFASFVGDEQVALNEPPAADPPKARDLSTAEAAPATEFIVNAATNRRVVILNEAHNVSRHRAFAADLMRALRPLGFDTLAAETFATDTPLRGGIQDYQAGRPFLPEYGTYSHDPVYAEMVREAAVLGYGFTVYEQTFDQRPKAASDDAFAAREEAEATNLAAFLADHPTARVLIYCGYGHLAKRPIHGQDVFARRLKAKTGIDPLTIEQSASWPRLSPSQDDPLTQSVMRRFAPTEPIVVHDRGQIVALAYQGDVDIAVFHPRTEPKAGRPGWLWGRAGRKPIEVRSVDVPLPYLLQAYPMDEGLAGLPADQILVTDRAATLTFLLRPGNYLIKTEQTDSGQILGTLTA